MRIPGMQYLTASVGWSRETQPKGWDSLADAKPEAPEPMGGGFGRDASKDVEVATVVGGGAKALGA